MSDKNEGKTVSAALTGQIVLACTKEALQRLLARLDALSEDESAAFDLETFLSWWTDEVEKASAVINEAAMRAVDATLKEDDDDAD